MIVNCFIIKQLADDLNKRLAGGKLIDCFSTGKDDLVFNFLTDKSLLNIKVTFIQNKPWFRFGDEINLKGKNNLFQFKPIFETEILEVNSVSFDRILFIRFVNGFVLVFKCHGNSSNVFLFDSNHSDFFQNFRKLKENEITSMDELLSQKIEFKKPSSKIETEKELKLSYPFLGEPELDYLSQASFLETKVFDQSKILDALFNTIKERGYFIVNNKLSIKLIEDNIKYSVMEFLTLGGEEFIRTWHKDQRKTSAIAELNKEIKQKQLYLKQCVQKQKENQSRISFQEMADLLMSHLTEISSSDTKFECLTFDESKKVSIQINPKLTPFENVEKYYKKSKNEYKEVQLLEDKIAKTNSDLEKLILKLHETETNENNVWSKKEAKKAEKEEILPYYSFKIDGFELRVGKNAKSNDQLISKFAQKHHLWLHARNVAGSHSIVVLNQSQVLPKYTLEKMASIAAYYSKAKSQSLVPVIYTERKYVRKPKGALPGEVKVEKEKVILVKPALPEK